MDNFTHSLAGWALSRAGLGRKTGLATPTLIIAANLPDIDAVCTIFGLRSLEMRRGLTHGPIALAILPILLWVAMLAFDHLQGKRGTRPLSRLPLHKGWLLALAYIGTISHPALDFLNNYGIRLLEPFSSRWFYGDTLFIIDVWVWTVLALGIWWSRRRSKNGEAGAAMPAIAALALTCVYIAGNGALSVHAESQTAQAVNARDGAIPDLVVASPEPVTFWRREMIWQGGKTIGWGSFDAIRDRAVKLDGPEVITNMGHPAIAKAQAVNDDAAAFMFWARMPYAIIEDIPGGQRVTIKDARFSNPLAADRFTVITELKE